MTVIQIWLDRGCLYNRNHDWCFIRFTHHVDARSNRNIATRSRHLLLILIVVRIDQLPCPHDDLSVCPPQQLNHCTKIDD
jgi:hypothetical protein